MADQPKAEESDEALLKRMRSSDHAMAMDAWGAFYHRHAEFVFNALMRRWGDTFTAPTVDDLAAETMRRAYERAETFEMSKGRARAWLMGIARRLVLATFEVRTLERAVALPDGDEEPLAPEAGGSREELSLAQQALRELDETEIAVLRLTGEYHPNRVSPGAMRALAERLGKTPEHLRQIRRRALQKIREALVRLQATTMGSESHG